MPAKRKTAKKDSTANLGFEAKLWLTADKLRDNMDAAEYKHVVLGLIFLKYISDSFEEHRAKLIHGEGDYEGANPEDPDEYKAENVFWVPADARWSHLQAAARQPNIGKTVDDAMVAIERDNPRLKGVLPKDYARPGLDKQRLGELIDVIATIELTAAGDDPDADNPNSGNRTHRSVDLLGRVYEYFLTRFASAEGKNGGQFYTPSCVVRCLVEMLKPYKGRIYASAAHAMRDDKLKVIAAELITQVKKSVTIDWTLRESARAKIKVMVKRILNRHGYPPDLQEDAVKTVLAQAELLCADWV